MVKKTGSYCINRMTCSSGVEKRRWGSNKKSARMLQTLYVWGVSSIKGYAAHHLQQTETASTLLSIKPTNIPDQPPKENPSHTRSHPRGQLTATATDTA